MEMYRTIGTALAWLFRSFLILAGIGYLYVGDVVMFIVILLMFNLTMVPVMLEQMYEVKIHWTFGLALSTIIAIHMFGTIGAYVWIPMYDSFAHSFSSATLAFIGFAIIFSMNYSGNIKTSLASMGIFTFLWTIGIGAVWEIIEFIWDNLVVYLWGSVIPVTYEFGFMQNSLFDTMTDLSLDGAAGVLVPILCVFIISRAKTADLRGIFNPFAKMIEHKKAKTPVTEKSR